ncbi:MAG: DHH family phosphoesterase [Candidatus Aenigmatarchaeota archaeon]
MEDFTRPAIEFFKKAKGEIAIVFGHDDDSIASSSVFFKLAKKLKLKPKLIVSFQNFEVDEKTAKKLEKFKNILITDIGDTPEERINKLSRKKLLLIVDHHLPKKYNCLYVNPRLVKKEIYMPASYISWLIYKQFFDSKEIEWIAAFGTLGDFGAEENKDLFLSLKKNFPELIGENKIKDRVLFERSLIGKIAKMIDACRIFEGLKGVKYASKVVANSKSYKDVLNDRKIRNLYKKLNTEFKKELKRLNKNKIEIDDFLIYEIKSKYNLKSSFASYLPKIFKNKIIFVAQKSNSYYEVSVRRGLKRKDDLSKIVSEITKSIRAKGGGHPTAAGMRVEDLKELIEFLKNKKKEKTLLC